MSKTDHAVTPSPSDKPLVSAPANPSGREALEKIVSELDAEHDHWYVASASSMRSIAAYVAAIELERDTWKERSCAWTVSFAEKCNELTALQGRVRTVTELTMMPFADTSPTRDEFTGEQTILTYCDRSGTWSLEFFESGDEFPERWIGGSHWLDISRMWPGVIAQVASFAIPVTEIDQ